jgi:hypothetical protein
MFLSVRSYFASINCENIYVARLVFFSKWIIPDLNHLRNRFWPRIACSGFQIQSFFLLGHFGYREAAIGGDSFAIGRHFHSGQYEAISGTKAFSAAGFIYSEKGVSDYSYEDECQWNAVKCTCTYWGQSCIDFGVEISDEVAPVKKMYVLYSSGLA